MMKQKFTYFAFACNKNLNSLIKTKKRKKTLFHCLAGCTILGPTSPLIRRKVGQIKIFIDV